MFLAHSFIILCMLLVRLLLLWLNSIECVSFFSDDFLLPLFVNFFSYIYLLWMPLINTVEIVGNVFTAKWKEENRLQWIERCRLRVSMRWMERDHSFWRQYQMIQCNVYKGYWLIFGVFVGGCFVFRLYLLLYLKNLGQQLPSFHLFRSSPSYLLCCALCKNRMERVVNEKDFHCAKVCPFRAIFIHQWNYFRFMNGIFTLIFLEGFFLSSSGFYYF